MGTEASTRRHPLPRPLIAILVVVVAAAIWAAAGLRSVPDDAIGLLDSAVRPDAAVGPGKHLALRGLEKLTVLAPYERESVLTWRSPEGSELPVRYELTARLTADGARRLLESDEGSGGARARLDRAVDAIVSGVIDDAPRADDGLPTLSEDTETTLAGLLDPYGEIEDGPRVAWDDTSPVVLTMLRERTRRQVQGLAEDTGVRLLIIGLDGADWQIADPLIEQGRLPNIASLKRRGAWSNIKSLSPMLSPLIWTSIATGVTADRHGVLDFLVRDPRTGAKVPVNSRFRKVRALWNIYTEADRSADFVAWWATWPAEKINGHMISDRVSYSLWDFDLPADGAGATYPPGYLAEIRDKLIGDDAITYEEVSRFADVSRETFDAERAMISQDREAAYRRPLNHLTKILASARNYHTIALDLLRRGPADLTAVYYQGIDEVGHRFMHYQVPRMDGIDETDVRRYGHVVERFYEYQDRQVGELLRQVGPDTTVILLSDHGFLNGPDRPRGQTADIEGQPAQWHRKYGMLILAGPPIRHVKLDTTSMLDITPTVLRLAGLPVADDMEGRVIEEALRDDFRERYPATHIATYDAAPLRLDAAPMSEAMASVEAEVMENLRALGYIGGGDDSPAPAPGAEGDAGTEGPAPDTDDTGTVTGHVNLASILLSNGELERAEEEIDAALAIAPTYPAARRQLFSLRLAQDRVDDALGIGRELVLDGEVDSEPFLARLAQAYVDAGRTDEGIEFCRQAIRGGAWQVGVPLARLHEAAGEPDLARRASLAVLEHDPLNAASMATMVELSRADGTLPRLEPLLRRALEKSPRSVMHLNWLAVVRESTGDFGQAESLLKRALEVDPDHGATMANLGAFYGRHGRAADAIPLLQRALRIEPGNLDARINLGTAYARLGRMDEAIAEFEAAVERGSTDTGVHNALARAYGERGDLQTAATWLRRSLEIDPDQPQIRGLLDQIERR